MSIREQRLEVILNRAKNFIYGMFWAFSVAYFFTNELLILLFSLMVLGMFLIWDLMEKGNVLDFTLTLSLNLLVLLLPPLAFIIGSDGNR